MELSSNMSIKEVIDVLEVNNVKDINNIHLWYDWFCTTGGLHGRGEKLLTRFKGIRKSKKFDPENTYLFFKNNCPCYGDNRLYDDFRICDRATGRVIFTVIPRNPYGKAEVYGRENDFKKPLAEGAWKDVKAFFLS